MQVSHAEDHITHAIVGGEEKIEFGISSDASFYQILSSTLYSDQKLAVIREVLCNAWDAHIDAGITDKPLHISLDHNTLVIQDFGLGIPRHLMGPIYATYGASTKANDGKATGGFGLGCKAPFAYTDNFEVTSCNQGTKTVYRISKSSAELGGKPSITPIVSVPTQETGLKVSINLKEAHDRARFNQLILRIARNGGIKAVYNGKDIEPLPVDQIKHGFILTLEEVLENHASVCIRYGNVIYPLEIHKDYHEQYREATKIVDRYSGNGQWTLVLQADPHTISVTPSRESLSMQDKTVATVKALLDKFLKMDFADFHKACFGAVKEQVNNELLEEGQQQVLEHFFKERESVRRNYGPGVVKNIFSTADFARSFMEHRYPNNTVFRRKELLYRIQVLMWDKDTTLDKRLLAKFRDELLRSTANTKNRKHLIQQDQRVTGWGKRYLVAPITLAMHGNPDLTKDRLYAIKPYSGWGGRVNNDDANVTSAPCLVQADLSDYIRFLRKIVIITHSRNNVWSRVRRFPGYNTIFNDNITGFVYHVPRIVKKVKAAREFFTNLGMQVVDLTAKIEYEEPGFSAKEKAEKKAKKAGYVKLSATLVNGYFIQDVIKNEDAARVEQPEFYTFLNARSHKHRSSRDLPAFNHDIAVRINRLWGDKGAAILTSAQVSKLEAEDAVHIDKFVRQQMVDFFTGNQTIMDWLGGSLKRAAELSSVSESTLNLFWNCPELAKKYNLGQSLPQHDADMYELFQLLYRFHKCEAYEEIHTALAKVNLSQPSIDMIDRIQASKTMKYVSKYDLFNDLRSKDKDIKTGAIRFLMQALKN